MNEGWLRRWADEAAIAWAIAVKDVRVYYLTPPMIMFGLLMPFFMFFSFSVRRGLGPEVSVARLLALTTFFTASSAGPVILPMERRARTFDRLLTAPVSLTAVLVGKALVGLFFGLAVSLVPLLAGLIGWRVGVAAPGLLAAGLVLSAAAFSLLGLLFASAPVESVGNIMMPSTLLRWPLLFISGLFIPLEQMSPAARAVSYLSPLTYAQDLLNHALLGRGVLPAGGDVLALGVSLAVFLGLASQLLAWSCRRGD